MEKRKKNIFLIVPLLTLCILLGYFIFSYSQVQRDTNSYFRLIEGNARLNESTIRVGEKRTLSFEDVIRTIGKSSFGVIEWGDGSITRLAGNSELVIGESYVSPDRNIIQISSHLEAGKSWSHVPSYIGEGSYFTQSFGDIEAGVRGTSFNIDLEQDVFFVQNHEVILEDQQGNIREVSEGQAMSLDTLSLIDIHEYLEYFEDALWREGNILADIEHDKLLEEALYTTSFMDTFIEKLFAFISSKYRVVDTLNNADSFEEVQTVLAGLSEEQYTEVYKELLTRYQSLNFLDTSDDQYMQKLWYKRAMLELSDDPGEKERLIQGLVYDFADTLENKNFNENFRETLGILQAHPDILKKIDISFLGRYFDLLPHGIEEEISESIDSIAHMLRNIKGTNLGETKNDITENAQKFIEEADTFIGERLNDTFNSLLQ